MVFRLFRLLDLPGSHHNILHSLLVRNRGMMN